MLTAARGPVPNLVQAIAGEAIRGSWWAHPSSHQIYRVLGGAYDSGQVLVCRLVGGKVTMVHRRLWPALVRVSGRLPKGGLAAIREEHTARGSHRVVRTPFPRWVPKQVVMQARRLNEVEAISNLGAELLQQISRRRKSSRAAPRGAPLSARVGTWRQAAASR